MAGVIGSGGLCADDREVLLVGVKPCLVVTEVDGHHTGILRPVFAVGCDYSFPASGKCTGAILLRPVNDLLDPGLLVHGDVAVSIHVHQVRVKGKVRGHADTGFIRKVGGQLKRIFAGPATCRINRKGIIRVYDVECLLMLVKVGHVITEVDGHFVAVRHPQLPGFFLIAGHNAAHLPGGLIPADQILPVSLNGRQVSLTVNLCIPGKIAGQGVGACVHSRAVFGIMGIIQLYDAVGPFLGCFHVGSLTSLGYNYL